MLAGILTNLIGVSLATGAIILALTLLSFKLDRVYGARWKYWVWLILALRLLLPFGLPLPQAPLQIAMPETQISIPQGLQPVPGLPFAQAASIAGQAGRTVSLVQVAALLWLIGFSLFLLHQLIGYRLFRQQALRWSRPVSNSQVTGRLQQLSREMGIVRAIVPLVSEKVAGPLMIGFVTPLLLLPHEEYAPAELSFILKHELVHLKRHDLWYKLLLLVANAVHWFNPLVYLMVREASKDLELACDDQVTRGTSFDDRKRYSEVILTAMQRQYTHQTALSTFFYGGVRTMEERFRNILNMKARRRGTVALLALLAGVVLVGGIVSCSTPGSGNDAVAVVKKSLEAERNNDFDAWVSTRIEEQQRAFTREANGTFGIISLMVHKVEVSERVTQVMKAQYSGSDLAQRRGWTDEYIAENMIVVYADYTVDYDNAVAPYDEGTLTQVFILVRDDPSSPWLIWDSAVRPLDSF
ncbi:MAG TPA: M56 family metallopeptidase [Anaerolineae bacterium]|nr:M56 family metallopeptidase [Anaerolineae bacterium]HOQ97510.1 M56 family metallopeptidase [Anaerolineae bacterium]HPL28541.1 M56 family metallopeptidase [Anaerolineae bacterium]